MTDKFYKKLPIVLQTTAIKNFFESTVEQLFSKSNTETAYGFIGNRSSEDFTARGVYVPEPSVSKRFYSLSPVVNTINTSTGNSQDLVFFDEFLDTLRTYNVDVRDQNKLFNETFYSYLPPVDVDKLLNYQEYYWYPAGPNAITITNYQNLTIDLAQMIAQQAEYNSESSYVISDIYLTDASLAQAGRAIQGSYGTTTFSSTITAVNLNDNVVTISPAVIVTLGELSEVLYLSLSTADLDIESEILSQQYYTPETGPAFRDGMVVKFTGPFIAPSDLLDTEFIVEGVGEKIFFVLKKDNIATRFTSLVPYPYDGSSIITDGANVRHSAFQITSVEVISSGAGYAENPSLGFLGTLTTDTGESTATGITDANGHITAVVVSSDAGQLYSGEVHVGLALLVNAANLDAIYGDIPVSLSVIPMMSVDNARVGQWVQGVVTGEIIAVNTVNKTITLASATTVDIAAALLNNRILATGPDFLAQVRSTDAQILGSGTLAVQRTQSRVGINPVTGDYYIYGGVWSFDRDIDGDGIGDLVWSEEVNQITPDYEVQARGATNKNVWSRVNFWYHKQNFIDAGQSVPALSYRATRPIVEFDHRLELYNHGKRSVGTVDVASTDLTLIDVRKLRPLDLVDGVPVENAYMIFPGEPPEISQHVYFAEQDPADSSALLITRVADPVLNPPGAVDGDTNFVPWTLTLDDVIHVTSGVNNLGNEYRFTASGLVLCQIKYTVNQDPVFNLYDIQGNYLADQGVYPHSTFQGNKIFNFATEVGTATNASLATTSDPVLNRYLVYRQFKASSEILYENYMFTANYAYMPFGSDAQTSITGMLFYKLTDDGQDSYYNIWRAHGGAHEQRIVTTYEITQFEVDQNTRVFGIGTTPRASAYTTSGYDITVKVNNELVEDFTYQDQNIEFSSRVFSMGDFIEVTVLSDLGLINDQGRSRYQPPLSWDHNILCVDPGYVSEPEYLVHFRNFMSQQLDFTGDPLANNNWSSTAKDPVLASEIVQTDQNLVLAAYLLDDQPHNLIDALRFNAAEYQKYKNRLRQEILNYLELYPDVSALSNDYVLEQVLRNVTAFRVGKNVFNRTYILPFGDNYDSTDIEVNDIFRTTYYSDYSADLDQVENALLVFHYTGGETRLLTADYDYTVVDYAPISIELTGTISPVAGDHIIMRVYNQDRDSAQCPATPSVLGLYPLSMPRIELDQSFQEAILVLVGHDGSKTPIANTRADEILLEFERRIYNGASKELRAATAISEFSKFNVKPGAFRDTGFSLRDWADVTRFYFSTWVNNTGVDAIKNEFYDSADAWTWNYRGTDVSDNAVPGYWRGWYEYYYDTVRPHTHPWEMLGFTEEPSWWQTVYGTDYGSGNTDMWEHLRDGIIFQGERANDGTDPATNLFDRPDLLSMLPVDAQGNLRSPQEIMPLASEQLATSEISASWRFGDLSPVENAWQYSETYAFAVTEALLLSRPGIFVTQFSNPLGIYRAAINSGYLVSRASNNFWKFTSEEDFKIHGSTGTLGNFVTTLGYTQFIHSWLEYQGLDTDTEFADKVRTLNVKIGHRFSGFVDKDTLTLRTDQYSSSGTATSLIIPRENIDIQLHGSPYKSRNYYSGVIIEKTAQNGYRVRGYDAISNYFTVLPSLTSGPRERVRVGGDSAPFVIWQPNSTYRQGTIVEHLGSFYQAPTTIINGDVFDRNLWKRLAVLPQLGGASATYYQITTGVPTRVEYGTEYATVDEVYDFLISLGRYQESQGFSFEDYDTELGNVRDWSYAAKQFLFWTTGKWETGNTLELSPLATGVTFRAAQGFIAKINRVDRDQFTIVDQSGATIQPTECEIVRLDDYISITPPAGRQIYGVMLFVKEIEHALVVDNITDFNDVIFDPVLNQRHKRLKIKTLRTLNWTGKLLSEGYVINGEELKPNLDNLAESLGRYHELGFIPVEKQIYDAARALFGYQKRDYLSELDIIDDEQFEFYRGMIHNKGTAESLKMISRSSAIVDGTMEIYDEWAIRVGDFGDVGNSQSIELKITKQEIVNDPQLVTLAFPEDITGIVDRIDIIERRYRYTSAPIIEIAPPSSSTGVQATAYATLNENSELGTIVMTNTGTGYDDSAFATIITGTIITGLVESQFNFVSALSTEAWIKTTSLSNITLQDHFSSNGAVVVNLSSATSAQDVANIINTTASLGGNITASVYASHVKRPTTQVIGYTLELSGADFSIIDADEDLYLTPGRYQPRQRYAIETSNSAVESQDIIVKIDGTYIASNSGANWSFDPGDVWTTQVSENITAGSGETLTIDLSLLGSGINHGSTELEPENIQMVNGDYPFVELYINDILVENKPYLGSYGTVPNVFQVLDTQTLVVRVESNALPQGVLVSYSDTPSVDNQASSLKYRLAKGTKIKVVEYATVDFNENFQGDLPGRSLAITAIARDGISIKLGTRRIYEITPDAQDDDVILIDIDDSQRFLKKPQGVRDFNLWPTTANLNHTGIIDPRYPTIPNAGYVYPDHVNFRAYGLSNLPELYGKSQMLKPRGGHTIHVANAENTGWDVYKLEGIGGSLSYILSGNQDVELYTDQSLFSYIDGNLIGDAQTNRYLDHYLSIQNAQISDNVVIWTAQDLVQQQHVEIRDIRAPRMAEARIQSMGPKNQFDILDISAVATKRYQGVTVSASDANNIITVSDFSNRDIKSGDTVFLACVKETTVTQSVTSYLGSGIVEFLSPETANLTLGVTIQMINSSDVNVNYDYFTVTLVDTITGTFRIQDPYFTAPTVAALGNVSFLLAEYDDFANNYTVSNVTSSSLTIENNSALNFSNVTMSHMTKSRLELSANHQCKVGDVVRVLANAFSGVYRVDATPSRTEIVVDAYYQDAAVKTGTLLLPGLEIKTQAPHGIQPDYAASQKRIAVHFAEPRSLNKTYTVTEVTPDTIILGNYLPESAETFVYSALDVVYADLGNATVSLSSKPLLSRGVVYYGRNSQVLNINDYVWNANGSITFSNAVLDANSSVSTEFVVTRELERTGNQLPVVTTLDHNRVKINGTELEIDQYNNIHGLVTSLNKQVNIRKIVTKNAGVSFKFIDSYNIPVYDPTTGANIPLLTVRNYGPYIRDTNVLTALAAAPGRIVGALPLNYANTDALDTDFNPGPRYSGATRGLSYYSQDLGRTLSWNWLTQSYTVDAPILTETELLSVIRFDTDTGRIVIADAYQDQFTDSLEAQIEFLSPPGHVAGAGNLTVITGNSGTEYDMTDTVSLDMVRPRYRLSVTGDLTYNVYETVQNTAGDIYAILREKVYPPLTAHDYYTTVSAYSDFGGLARVDTYYQNQTEFNPFAPDDAISNTTGVIAPLPPVEPAFYAGKQLIPEPFAVYGGNGTDAQKNFESLPQLVLGSARLGSTTHVRVMTTGMNEFMLWTPGLVPGDWAPSKRAPLNAGVLGYGSGYYTTGDNHQPLTTRLDTVGAYPALPLEAQGWGAKLPRFMYSRDFSVFPTANNINPSYVPEAQDATDPRLVQYVRPQELFVACFWTEPYTYENQLVGFDYRNTDSQGNPAPIYQDYAGTITRVKYIRLTELPADAVLTRPVPDTGWGGLGWRNIITDSVSSKFQVHDEQEIWKMFSPTYITAGGTDDNVPESPLTTTGGAVRNICPTPAGDRIDLGAVTEQVPLVGTVNDPYMVLNGSVLSRLPPPTLVTRVFNEYHTDLTPSTGERRYDVVTNSHYTPDTLLAGSWEHHTFKIAGNDNFKIVFDFSATLLSAAGITVVQSHTPYALDFDPYVARATGSNPDRDRELEYWSSANVVTTLSTQGDGASYPTNGSQIRDYGNDLMRNGELFAESGTRKTALAAFGITSTQAKEISGKHALDKDTATLATANNTCLYSVYPALGAHDLGVKGVGFIEGNIDQSQGKYVTVFVHYGDDSRDPSYALFVSYLSADAQIERNTRDQTSLADAEPSSAYSDGASVQLYTFRSTNNKATGYFCAPVTLNGVETHYPNIYFPYHSAQGANASFVPAEITASSDYYLAGGVPARALVKSTDLTEFAQSGALPEYSTVEIQGYFASATTGNVWFRITTQAQAYAWINGLGHDDLSGAELYKQPGYRSGTNYTVANATLKPTVSSAQVSMEANKYYFIRSIFGTNKPGVSLAFEYSLDGLSWRTVTFSGRTVTSTTGAHTPLVAASSARMAPYAMLTPGALETLAQPQDLLPKNRYINTSVQRVTGGFIVPLAKPAINRQRDTSPPIKVDPLATASTFRVPGTVPAPRAIDTKVNLSGTIVLNNRSQDLAFPATPSEIKVEARPSENFVSNILFNNRPCLSLTALRLVGTDQYEATRPSIRVPMYRPTPSVTISGEKLAKIKLGSEIIINDVSVIIRSNSVTDLAQTINAARAGVIALADTQNNSVFIQSRNESVINFRDGRAGSNNFRVGSYTVTGSSTGYSVGDRLRLLGGKPLRVSDGSILAVNILDGGSGYGSIDDLTVVISSDAGYGAQARVTRLSATGAIEAIEMVAPGIGYDPHALPSIRVISAAATQVSPALLSVTLGQTTRENSLARVAKFIVTGVDAAGKIQSMKMIDPGLYETLPDSADGFSLEYDYAQDQGYLGLVDPSNEFHPYGVGHPDYDLGIFVNRKHPDWAGVSEFRQDVLTGQFVPYTGTAGAYDPGTYVLTNGTLKRKEFVIDIGGTDEYTSPHAAPGGSGALLSVTSQAVFSGDETSNITSTLGLPAQINELNIARCLAAWINVTLAQQGVNKNEISAQTDKTGSGITSLDLNTSYDALHIDSDSPGFLNLLGIPAGTYTVNMLSLSSVLSTPDTKKSLKEQNKINDILGNTTLDQQDLGNADILSILQARTLGTDLHSVFGLSNARFYNQLYKYTLKNINAQPLRISATQGKQNASVYVFKSLRYDTEAAITGSLADYDKLWIDNYQGLGWAYLEQGQVVSRQQPLVDVDYIRNAMIYDESSGNREVDLEFWDPFKGILPGFIRNEIAFISEVDPVTYNTARSNFGRNNLGKVWWDTSTVRYNWYEQDTNKSRWKNWGSMFPGSTITVCEWVESKALPQNWTGDGRPRWMDRYITERHYDQESGKHINYYYYWVQNRSTLTERARQLAGRALDTQTLSRYLANPRGLGVSMISFVSTDAFVLTNIGQVLRDDDNIVQINFSRNLNPEGIKHTAWKLMRENDNNSVVPDQLTLKLIDSLAGENAIGQPVPDPMLSTVEKYGIEFRPRQTMFRDVKEARRVFAYALNSILSDLRLKTNYPLWDLNLPASMTYFSRANWYEVMRVDQATNQKIRYDSSYKPVFNVSSVTELRALTSLPDGTVIQVQGSATGRSQLYVFEASTGTFKLISVAQDTLVVNPAIYSADTNAVMSYEIRAVLTALNSTVFVNTVYWNNIFFELLKYVYLEQKQLSWAFKTSYLYVEKNEEDLIQFSGFRADNFDKILNYLNEVKPFSAKIRDYKNGKSAPVEVITQGSISDYDKPAYPDRDLGYNRVLDENNTDDQVILSSSPVYLKYNSVADKSQDPFRRVNTTMYFDRTHWLFAQFGWDSAQTPANLSIARNIANLNIMSSTEVGSNTSIRAIDRIFKSDPTVREVFAQDIDLYLLNLDGRYDDPAEPWDTVSLEAGALLSRYESGELTPGTDPLIIANTEVMYNLIQAGAVNRTLALLKTLVGGDFRGESLDAYTFRDIVPGFDATTDVIQYQGYNAHGWDTQVLDTYDIVRNYQGVFNSDTQGTDTLIRSGELYAGFDSAGFKRLYGSERTEEMVFLDPLESLIVRVHTNTHMESNTVFTANVSAGSIVDITYEGNISDRSYGIAATGTTLTIQGDGVDATATATVVANRITTITITDPGTGYTEATVTLEGNVRLPYAPVSYQIHHNAFGGTQYMRLVDRGVTLATDLTTSDTEVQVSDASLLPVPDINKPVVIWIGTEALSYAQVDGNTLKRVRRGVAGTTRESWTLGQVVYQGNHSEIIRGNFDPEQQDWLDTAARSLASEANVSNDNSIMRFLHNLI